MVESSTPKRRSLAAVFGGVLLTVVAGGLGITLVDDTDRDSTATAPASVQEAEGVADEVVLSDSGLPSCVLDSLPGQTSLVVGDILDGGPFPYPANDGTRFGNYEGVLPDEPLGYYREYTVDTPGLNHRGARRIVTGGGSETDPDVWYYTDDHYESFCEIPHDE